MIWAMVFTLGFMLFFIGIGFLFWYVQKKEREFTVKRHREKFTKFEEVLRGKDFNVSKRIVLIDELNGEWGFHSRYEAVGIWFDSKNQKIALLLNDKSEIIFSFKELVSYHFDSLGTIPTTPIAVTNNVFRIVIKNGEHTQSKEFNFGGISGRMLVLADRCMKNIADELDNILAQEKSPLN